MKKYMSIIGVVLSMSVLSGCMNTRPIPKKESPVTKEESTQDMKVDNSDSKIQSNKEDSSSDKVDISSAIDGSKTKDTDAVPLGEWAKITRYSTEDKTYHTVYVRIAKVTTQSKDPDYVKSAIDLHNANSYDYDQIDLSAVELPSDVELCILDYDVFVPEDFPSGEYGINEPRIIFNQDNIGGGGIPTADGTSTYIGMGSNTEDLAVSEDQKYESGNTYSLRSAFTMVKGYTEYVFSTMAYKEGTKDSTQDSMYDAYFANK